MKTPQQFCQDGKVTTFSRVNLSMIKVGDKIKTITGGLIYEKIEADDNGNNVKDEVGNCFWLPDSFPGFKITKI